MEIIEKILTNLDVSFGRGLSREPQEFVYLDRISLYEHFKSLTGKNYVPISTNQSSGASAGVGILGMQVGSSGQTSTNIEVSDLTCLKL